MFKVCRTCGESKETSEFYPHPTAKDGFRNSCKPCTMIKQKANLNIDRVKEYRKKYYKENSKEIKEKVRLWTEDNIEHVRKVSREYSREKRQLDPEQAKIRARGYALKAKYGITLGQYEELLDSQNRCCAICDRHESEFKSSLAIDHSHRTGRIRGALCTGCNYRLVARHEDPELLRKIADYISTGTDWFVPKKIKKRRSRRGK